MPRNLAALRSLAEFSLQGKVSAPFVYRDRSPFETVSSGIRQIDELTGGVPRGALTEICGPPCSGRTTLLLSTLAARTTEGEVCALVDAQDSFDPYSASIAGVELGQLLWVRCRNIDQALRATDLLIQSGGFGLVAIDLSDVPPKIVRHVPLNVWFRFRRAVEDTPTVLMLLEQESSAKTCASLVLRLDAEPVRWSSTMSAFRPGSVDGSFTRLLQSASIRSNVIRSRMRRNVTVFPGSEFCANTGSKDPGLFEASTLWMDFSNSYLRGEL
jgi:hypothetical protein